MISLKNEQKFALEMRNFSSVDGTSFMDEKKQKETILPWKISVFFHGFH